MSKSSTYALNLTYLLQMPAQGLPTAARRAGQGAAEVHARGRVREGPRDERTSAWRPPASDSPAASAATKRTRRRSCSRSRPERRRASLPTLALTHLWRNAAGLTWQPLGMLNLSGDLTSTRDLRVYPDSTTLGRLAYAERRFLLGIPVGVERDRSLVTALALTPGLASWLRPRFLFNQQLRASRTLYEPGAGAGRRRQRRLHPAADPQQRADQRARRVDRFRARPAAPGGRQQRARQGAWRACGRST